MPENESQIKNERFWSLRHIWTWLVTILIAGGIFSVLVNHMLDRLRQPETKLVTDVKFTVDTFPNDPRVNTVTHQILLRNEGKIAFNDLSFHIRFASTADKPTIGGPVIVARPDAILDASTKSWIVPNNKYRIDIDDFAPGAEILLTFDADQFLIITIEALGDGVQYSQDYTVKFD